MVLSQFYKIPGENKVTFLSKRFQWRKMQTSSLPNFVLSSIKQNMQNTLLKLSRDRWGLVIRMR
jgi:hypothetical protein